MLKLTIYKLQKFTRMYFLFGSWYFCTVKFQKSTKMENSNYVFSKLEDMTVSMQTQEQKNMTVLRGKALLNECEQRFTFIQNKPRGKRSVEIGRSDHSRMVRRPDGLYTLTFRFDVKERFLKEQLLSEVRGLVKLADADFKKRIVMDNKKGGEK